MHLLNGKERKHWRFANPKYIRNRGIGHAEIEKGNLSTLRKRSKPGKDLLFNGVPVGKTKSKLICTGNQPQYVRT